jgi:flagellar basal-body rod protein FlgC
MLDGGTGKLGAGSRVQVLDVVESAEPLRKAYEPGNPVANADGMVFYPNVNQVAEMTDMMSASRAFETNVEVLGRIKSMQAGLLRLGEG